MTRRAPKVILKATGNTEHRLSDGVKSLARKEKAMDEVKIGFVGCGGNARGHMNRLLKVEGARIVAVCDLVEALAQQEAELTGGAVYTDYRRLLERDDLDAVYLSIPVFAHGEPELAVIERGLPFLVEKPVAREMETARKIEAAVQEAGLLTCVGYQLRYSGTADIAREALSGETVGMAVGRYWCGSGRGEAGRWVQQFAKSGGQLVEQATHTIDMMRFLIGEVAEVTTRQASRKLHHIDCPDVYAVTFVFENGGAVFLKMYTPPEADTMEAFEHVLGLSRRRPYFGELKRPQPPWPRGALGDR